MCDELQKYITIGKNIAKKEPTFFSIYDDIEKLLALGVGASRGNHDIRDYDPEEYSGVEMLVLALQDHFKNIGGPGVGVTRYIETLKIYYPDTTDSILRLSVAAVLEKYPLYTPISDKYHPPLDELYGGIIGYYDFSPKQTEVVMGTYNEIADDALSGLITN